MGKNKMLKILYKEAKAAEVGENCICPSCRTKFEKTNYQQAFCKSRTGTKCKDYYWNNVTPTKKNNVTRISPASAAYLASKERQRIYEPQRQRPQAWEVFGVWHDDDWHEHDGGSGGF